MSKAILISIKPKYVADILNGKKTIEIRKTMPKCDLPIDVYIYCTKDNHQLVKPKDYDKHLLFTKGAVNYLQEQSLNGKVVAKFTLNKVEMIVYKYLIYSTRTLDETYLLNKSNLSYNELDDYLRGFGYAWHIDNLIIFDKPKELSGFVIARPTKPLYSLTDINKKEPIRFKSIKPLTKSPQSWCYVEVLENE